MSDEKPDGQDAKHVSRRAALKTLGVIPVVGGLDWSQLVRKHTTAPRPAALEPESDAPYTLKFFKPHEFRTLQVVADYIIPRDEKSGSATDSKAPEFIDFMLADKEASESSRTSMRGALAWLDTECSNRYGKTFVGSSDAQRRALLDDIAFPKKARPEMAYGVTAFNRIRDAVASGFYSSAMGWKDLQYIGNVFNPNWNGCPEPALRKLGVSYDEYNASLAGRRTK